MESDSQTNIFRSKLPTIQIPTHLPLHSYIFDHHLSDDSSRNHPCLIDAATNHTLTYAAVNLTSLRLAAALRRSLNVCGGSVIMILLPNSREFILSFLAASRLGAVATAANPFHTAEEIGKHARMAGCNILITEWGSLDKVERLVTDGTLDWVVVVDGSPSQLPGKKLVLFWELVEGVKEEEEELAEELGKVEAEDVVAMPFSSGTTGLPKGVLLTHKAKVTSVAQQVDGENPNLYLHNQDVILCVLPLFHIYSLNITLCALRVGASILIMRRFDVAALFHNIHSFRVTVAPMVPTIVLATTARTSESQNYDLSSVRILKSGAAPLGKKLEDSIKAVFPRATFGQGYGMTEAGPVLAMSLGFAKKPFIVKSGACGTVVRNAEMKIVDPDSGISLPRSQPGEICIRGDQIMKGYLNDEEATERTIDKEGWLHTGDVGYIDEDDELFIVDRLKELIKYKGFQVAPAELEAMLLNHPGISDAAVVAKKDDDAAGELPVAFVVKPEAYEITEDEIKNFISKQVVFYKRIHHVFFLDSIPKGPSGKILRKDLRSRLVGCSV